MVFREMRESNGMVGSVKRWQENGVDEAINVAYSFTTCKALYYDNSFRYSTRRRN